MTPEELKREDEFLEAQAKAIREHIERMKVRLLDYETRLNTPEIIDA